MHSSRTDQGVGCPVFFATLFKRLPNGSGATTCACVHCRGSVSEGMTRCRMRAHLSCCYLSLQYTPGGTAQNGKSCDNNKSQESQTRSVWVQYSDAHMVQSVAKLIAAELGDTCRSQRFSAPAGQRMATDELQSVADWSADVRSRSACLPRRVSSLRTSASTQPVFPGLCTPPVCASLGCVCPRLCCAEPWCTTADNCCSPLV